LEIPAFFLECQSARSNAFGWNQVSTSPFVTFPRPVLGEVNHVGFMVEERPPQAVGHSPHDNQLELIAPFRAPARFS
jgi:hypothetical protein